MKLLSWMAAIEIRKRATKTTDKSRHFKRTDFARIIFISPSTMLQTKVQQRSEIQNKKYKKWDFFSRAKGPKEWKTMSMKWIQIVERGFSFLFSAEGDILHFSPEKCIPWGVNNFDIFTIACPERNLNSV
jgi:hypothetical protein